MSKILGIDYGQKYIGTALSSEVTQEPVLAFSHKVFNNTKNFFKEIKEVIGEEEIDLIIIGLPLGFNFKDTEQTKTVKMWTENLKKEIPTSVIFENEIFTSLLSKKKSAFKISRKDLNTKAAREILQSYLDRIYRR